MKKDKRIQDCIDQNLSGLRVSPQRQREMIETITGGEKMKKKIPVSLALAAVLVMVSMTALAVGTNLFEYFSAKDARYANLIDKVTLETTAPVSAESETLGKINARIDSAYYDGSSLSVGIIVENAFRIEEYTPNSGELTNDMIVVDPVAMSGRTEEERRIMQAWSAAIEKGEPYGYVICSAYLSDHLAANDVDLPPYKGGQDSDESGTFRTIRDYVLEDEVLLDQAALNLSVKLYEGRSVCWFDGKDIYCYQIASREVGQITATVKRTDAVAGTYAGSVAIDGVEFAADATLSEMNGAIIINSEEGFFRLKEFEYGEYLPWTVLVFDEDGREYASDGITMTNSQEQITCQIEGSGVTPEELHVYLLKETVQMDVYEYWPDADAKRDNPHIILKKAR